MTIQFNHTLIHAHDKEKSAAFLTEILGLPPARAWGPFMAVELDNGVSLDFVDAGGMEFDTQHYAFLIGEPDFDAVFARIQGRGLSYWADPFKRKPGEINRHDGGRGVYFDDPDGHLLEVLSRPYGETR